MIFGISISNNIKCSFNFSEDALAHLHRQGFNGRSSRFDDYVYMSISFLAKHMASSFPFYLQMKEIPVIDLLTPMVLAEIYEPGNVKINLPASIRPQRTMMVAFVFEFASYLQAHVQDRVLFSTCDHSIHSPCIVCDTGEERCVRRMTTTPRIEVSTESGGLFLGMIKDNRGSIMRSSVRRSSEDARCIQIYRNAHQRQATVHVFCNADEMQCLVLGAVKLFTELYSYDSEMQPKLAIVGFRDGRDWERSHKMEAIQCQRSSDPPVEDADAR